VTRDTPPFPLAAVAGGAVIEPDDRQELPPRQCGRCRMMFEGDPTLDIRLRNEWCLCPACEAILLPARARRGNVIDLRRQAVRGVETPAVEQ
jgi:hypothetical protein